MKPSRHRTHTISTQNECFRLPKANSHPYQEETVWFATIHRKEEVLRPLLSSIGIRCEKAPVDTDAFGTFSGEVPRQWSVRETLRRKTQAVFELLPSARLALASEGTFAPHPQIGFLSSDHEALLLSDREKNLEIYVDILDCDTNHAALQYKDESSLRVFLDQIGFPSHAVNIKSNRRLFKGLRDIELVFSSVNDCQRHDSTSAITVFTDMRADRNPTRMRVIQKAGKKLMERLTSFCIKCDTVGFGEVDRIVGLPCEWCGSLTELVKEEVWGCLVCKYAERRPRRDGAHVADPGFCQLCNP